LHEEALLITKKNLGEEHIQVATHLNNLAVIEQNLGNYQKAKELNEEVLLIKRKNLGEEHIELFLEKINLSIIEQKL